MKTIKRIVIGTESSRTARGTTPFGEKWSPRDRNYKRQMSLNGEVAKDLSQVFYLLTNLHQANLFQRWVTEITLKVTNIKYDEMQGSGPERVRTVYASAKSRSSEKIWIYSQSTDSMTFSWSSLVAIGQESPEQGVIYRVAVLNELRGRDEICPGPRDFHLKQTYKVRFGHNTDGDFLKLPPKERPDNRDLCCYLDFELLCSRIARKVGLKSTSPFAWLDVLKKYQLSINPLQLDRVYYTPI